MTFYPLTNYAGYEHVLNAAPGCIHPNGNIYGCAIEKQGGTRQNLSVYRLRPGATTPELVHRYFGGVDSVAQFAMGGCVLLPDGALDVWAVLIPFGTLLTKTGFQGMRTRIDGVDQPWGSTDPTLEQRITAIETALGTIAASIGAPLKSTVLAAPDDPIWGDDAAAVARLRQVLQYYGWLEEG